MINYFLLLFTLIIAVPLSAQEKDTSAGKTFIYVLKLTPGYYDDNNWSEKDKETIQIHFKHLQEMLAQGKLILAGRTDTENEKTFGIVVYKADSYEEAVERANDDPGVKAGIMSVEIFPFNLALIKGD